MDDRLGVLARLLEEAGGRYALIGGHAVNAWLEPRFTSGVDLTIEAGVEQMQRLTRVLEGAGFELEFTEGASEPSGPDFVRFTDPVFISRSTHTNLGARQRSRIGRRFQHQLVMTHAPRELGTP